MAGILNIGTFVSCFTMPKSSDFFVIRKASVTFDFSSDDPVSDRSQEPFASLHNGSRHDVSRDDISRHGISGIPVISGIFVMIS